MSLWVIAYGVYLRLFLLTVVEEGVKHPRTGQKRSHEAIRQSVGPQVLLSGEQVPREEGLRAFIPS